jgi:hypothetical protein
MTAITPRHRRWILALIFFCLVATGRADETRPIPPFEARYRIYQADIPVGEVILQLEYEDAERYRMRSSLSVSGLARLIDARSEKEEVEGKIVGGVPRPLRYRAERTGNKTRKVSLDFAWDRGEVTSVVNEETSTIKLGTRTVDPLSLYLLTMLDLHSDRPADAYNVVARGRLKTYQIRPLGETTIPTPMGKLATLSFARQRPESSKGATFWHAPELNFLPVQVSNTKDGEETSRLVIDHLAR